ncbi:MULTISPECIES: YadA-like family protein [Pasteurellaceae]|uniref:YadA-like family protein n=1 Tax=Pasteurella atlantica TaxID=2827233 RepID=A0AAW8CPR6_9PAST|nr:YadA-like family protein [Pasteurella atlantica]MBR0574478.1 YadA-like family protein [Pasteurella atlantica]MDP8039356.1 YadA-like family protein [Pasteurella atlantica]MDP8041448.1 YadA-like family protein [Pasteurella atlantica]MDP8043627.1 YadA-like family protein [Pasteurella atlantica]MDP8045669.1 YadA-like family protein [Pasteurella atlantica]
MLANAEQIKNNWEGINPSKKDLLLTKEYERVAKILLEKGNLLKTASERLKYLKDNLTLNYLTNVGADSIAYGTDNLATGNASIALGKSNVSTKENATAIGQTNLVDSKNSQAIGVGNNLLSANTTSENQATLGNANTLVGTNNYVVGSNNSVGTQNSPKNNVFILGSNINASNASDAVILGNQSTAVSGAVSVGRVGAERKIVNVKDGDVSQNSKEAVNGSQLHSLRAELLNARDAINGKQAEELRSQIIQNAKNIKLLDGYVSDVRRFDSRITNVEKSVKKLDEKRKAGTAAALATAGLMQPMHAGQSGVTAAVGQYQSQTAIAVGYSKISNNGKYGVKMSLNANTQSEMGGTIGVGYFW